MHPNNVSDIVDMLKSIELSNFFSFHSVKVELGELNTLIGINGSGKTNFLKAISVLKAIVSEGGLQNLMLNQWGGFDAVYYAGSHGHNEKPVIRLRYEFIPEVLSGYGYTFLEPVIYEIMFYKVASTQNYFISENMKTVTGYSYFRMNKGKGFAMEGASNDQHKVEYSLDGGNESIFSQVIDKDRYVQVYALREAIKSIASYRYFDTTASSPIRKPVMPTVAVRLLQDGSNLPQLLNKIKINNKSGYNAIKKALNSVNPNYTGIDFNILGSNIELMLEEDRLERSVHVTHISDGTLRYLCLLSIIYNAQRGSLVCIDEPEIGLHPDMIAEIIEGIQSNCQDSQFIISTHSEYVLNQLSVKDVMVCEKDDDNATQITTFTDIEFQQWASSYATGRLWRNGDLGGNRY